MVKVCFKITDNGKVLICEVKGHAGGDVKGRDLVCAGVTTLTGTLAFCVNAMQKAGRLKKEPTIRLDEGDAVIVCKPKRDCIPEALHLYSVIQAGMALLSEGHPACVDVKPFGEA